LTQRISTGSALANFKINHKNVNQAPPNRKGEYRQLKDIQADWHRLWGASSWIRERVTAYALEVENEDLNSE
jgi:hypothetical protein